MKVRRMLLKKGCKTYQKLFKFSARNDNLMSNRMSGDDHLRRDLYL